MAEAPRKTSIIWLRASSFIFIAEIVRGKSDGLEDREMNCMRCDARFTAETIHAIDYHRTGAQIGLRSVVRGRMSAVGRTVVRNPFLTTVLCDPILNAPGPIRVIRDSRLILNLRSSFLNRVRHQRMTPWSNFPSNRAA